MMARLAYLERTYKSTLMRWKCICAYKGTQFEGWQNQPSGGGVQNHIESALTSIFDTSTRIHGCSRTDAGVHAKGQCFHFEANWPHPDKKLVRAMHSILDKDIRIESLQKVSDDFHARFSAVKKAYKYSIYLGRAHPFDKEFVWACRDNPLDLGRMITASKHLVGTHDFTAFGALHTKDNDPNPIKSVESIELKKRGSTITLSITGSGFLYKMVRSIAGTLYAVGRNRLSPEDTLRILESKTRTNEIVTAPASGLSLEKIFYD